MVPALRRLRWEECNQFEASLGYRLDNQKPDNANVLAHAYSPGTREAEADRSLSL